MNRKLSLGIAFGVIAIVAIIGLAIALWPRTFRLDENYYGRSISEGKILRYHRFILPKNVLSYTVMAI